MTPRETGLDAMPIEIEIFSYWRTATGAGQAARQDILCALDHEGLPYIPARQIKGLLRDAVRRLDVWANRPEVDRKQSDKRQDYETALFGQQGFNPSPDEDAEPVPFRGAKPGALTLTSARLAPAERAAFAGSNAARAALFDTLSSTAMENGVARDHSLRNEQVAIPMTLYAEIGVEPPPDFPADLRSRWQAIIRDALPLVRAVGGKRRRGLGRAQFRQAGAVDAA